MIFSGLQKTSFSDFPGRVAAVVFTRGCNFRCPYCHNPELVIGKSPQTLPDDEVFSYLEKRRGRLGGLVVSGGEPTLQPGLPRFLRSVRELGYAIKLDTNGSRPEMLQRLIDDELLDYVAMDIKAPLSKYSKVARSSIDIEEVQRSIQLLFDNDIEYEFRTTAVRACVSNEDILEIGELLQGAQQYVLQPFVSTQVLDQSINNSKDFTAVELSMLSQQITASDLPCWVR